MTPRVLIADSDAEMLELCRRYFHRIGVDVETAVDGLDCWNKLRDPAPDVVVLEYELPWGGGDGIIAVMREGHSVQPVVLVTDHPQPNKLARHIGSPVVACLERPFRLEALAAEVRSALRKRSEWNGGALSGNTGIES